jgi:hypothetical protein
MKRSTALTAAAGEHFVAFKLSEMGFPVALTRGGSPTVDLIVGDLSGHAAMSIQVKTSSRARRKYVTKPEKNHWEWDVGRKALTLRGDRIFYVFVDLRGNPDVMPDIFVVPSIVVAEAMKPSYSRFMFWIRESEVDRYRGRWDSIALELGTGSDERDGA